jgi:hypothetical protein
MSWPFACLGFADNGGEPDLRRLIPKILSGKRMPTEAGVYVQWSPGADAELWLQLNPAGEVIGLSPHFDGYGSMPVSSIQAITRAGESALDGAFHAWCQPDLYPFVFDAPDARLFASSLSTGIMKLQLAAFAQELAAYATEAEFMNAQSGSTPYASRSFVPSGLFTSHEPSAHAFVTGHVLRAQQRLNPFTGLEFQWALVETYGGTVDVLAEPATIVGPIEIGGVVQGTFWLSGRKATGSRPLSKTYFRPGPG